MRMRRFCPFCVTRFSARILNGTTLLSIAIFLACSVASAQTVTLAWDPSTATGVAGYKVYRGTASRVYGPATTVGNVTTYVTPTLSPGTYYFAVTSYTTAGAESAYSNEVTATVSSSDTTAPTITGVGTSNISTTGATVSWITNEASDSQVEYGASSSYGQTTALNTSLVTSHSVALSGLQPNTLYYYRVRSRDAARNLATSAGSSFRTATAPVGDTTPPTVTMTAPASGATVSGTVTLSATATDNVGVAGVQFLVNDSPVGNEDTASPYTTSWNTAAVSDGSYTLTGRARDAAGNTRVSAGVTVQVRNSNSLLTGLQAGFPLNEGSGTTAQDISANANNATLSRTSWAAGRFGNGLSFNGSSSYASAGARSIPAPNATQTVSWFYLVSSNSNSAQVMIRLSNTTRSAELNFGIRNSRFGVWNQNSAWIVSAARPAAGLWHHVAYTFTGTTHSLFVDGVLAATSTVAAGTTPISIVEFGRGARSRNYFSGRLDDIRIYNRLLSTSEIGSVRTTPLSSGTAAGAPMMLTQVQESEASTPAVEILTSALVAQKAPEYRAITENSATERVLVPRSIRHADSVMPQIDFHLSKRSFSGDEPVELTRFSVVNPSTVNRPVELKTWLASASAAPESLGTTGEDGSFVLPSGVDSDFGPVKVFDSSDNPADGFYRIASRMLDPITGEILSEKQASFTVASARGAARAVPVLDLPEIEVNAEMSAFDYSVGDTISVTDFSVRNSGKEAASVEVKLWLESGEIDPVPLLHMGADGNLVLGPGADARFFRPRDLIVTEAIPRGNYALRCRILDPVTGQVFAEHSADFKVQ